MAKARFTITVEADDPDTIGEWETWHFHERTEPDVDVEVESFERLDF